MLNIQVTTPPDLSTNAERCARYRAADPARASENRRRYRHNNSKWQTDAEYLSRPFVAWDGEGYTTADGVHRYAMLAVKSTTDGAYWFEETGLGTAQIFSSMLDFAATCGDAIHVIYGGGYDFNMTFRDIPREIMDKVYRNKFAVWQNFRIGWRPGKSLYLSRVGTNGKKLGRGLTIYDVVPFFQCAFVKACDEYLGSKFYERDLIVRNKALRSTFAPADVPEIRVYNDAELVNLLALMAELRARLNKCGLRPRRWDGPGAIAAALLLREHVKDAKAVTPKRVAKAARYAYAGGRFEVIQYGHVESTDERPVAWEYDINSAYPSALRNVPDLSSGRWKHHIGDPGPHVFALYRVRYSGNRPDLPGAFFRRDPNGTICYPLNLTGWYWSPEVATGRAYCELGYGSMEILEAWTYDPGSGGYPFAFIEPLYNKRRALKKAGDGAHVGIKLALNSLYGKLAQQVGAEKQDDGTWRIPPFHQLEWAGYTTSWCRAEILRACLPHLSNVIAFETDAVFTTVPLDVVIGSGLGDFEAVEFSSLTYVQSGMYYGDTAAGLVTKTRGVDRGSLTRETVLEKMQERAARDRYATASLTRFIGAGVALAQSWERWRRWETIDKHMALEPTGKRVHALCSCMRARNTGIPLGRLHSTICPLMNDAESSEFPIAWINPDADMSELEELRREVPDYE